MVSPNIDNFYQMVSAGFKWGKIFKNQCVV
jgi:hypothetical protein